METEKKYCYYCAKLLRGRSDKKYCNDDCRNAHFNQQKKNDNKAFRQIDLLLKKNRKILKEILGTRKTRNLSEKNLLQKGFNFGYHTHFFKTRNDDNYIFCYDYGYLLRNDGEYMIVKEIQTFKD